MLHASPSREDAVLRAPLCLELPQLCAYKQLQKFQPRPAFPFSDRPQPPHHGIAVSIPFARPPKVLHAFHVAAIAWIASPPATSFRVPQLLALALAFAVVAAPQRSLQKCQPECKQESEPQPKLES